MNNQPSFVELVRHLRAAQRAALKTNALADHEHAQQWENKIDRWLTTHHAESPPPTAPPPNDATTHP